MAGAARAERGLASGGYFGAVAQVSPLPLTAPVLEATAATTDGGTLMVLASGDVRWAGDDDLTMHQVAEAPL